MSTPTKYLDAVPITKDTLIEQYLFGLKLEDGKGNPFPDIMYERAIEYAIDYLQRQVDICILPTTIVNEQHDYLIEDYRNFVHLPMDKIPILSVERVSIEWPLGTEVLTFPTEWISWDPLRTVNIVPVGGAGLAAVMIGAGQILLPLLYGGASRVPNLIHVDYTSGLPLNEIPADILHAISLYACIQILHPAGDLIIGPGIANQEIVMNQLRQKIETTSSPTNAGYGARIINYKNELKEMITAFRTYYHGVPLYAS